jgi:enamine deaminase RidA (YjgF/YER057c/UK114 family)
MNDIDKQIKIINKKIDKLVEEMEEEKDEFLSVEVYIPDWEEVQKKKVLYESYATVTRRNDELNRILTKLGTTIIAIKDLKNSLRISEDMPPR